MTDLSNTQKPFVTKEVIKKSYDHLEPEYKISLIGLILLFSFSTHSSTKDSQSAPLSDETMVCTLYQVAIQTADDKHQTSLHCEDPQGLLFEIIGQTAAITKQYLMTNKTIESRLNDHVTQSTRIKKQQTAELNTVVSKLRHQLKQTAHPKLTLSQFQWRSDKIILSDLTTWAVSLNESELTNKLKAFLNEGKTALLAAAQGTDERTALVIHVTANDFSTTDTPASLGDSVFGTNGDEVNLSSQFSACSYQQFNFMPAQGQHISDGVVELSIDIDVEGMSRGTVRNAVVAAANELFGSLSAQADHFLFALPPNTDGNWIAYGTVNGTYTTYNDRWATYVSAQMHELGHNLGMGHSGIGSNEYNDKSGMMGVSYSSDDGPVMCFNSPKSSKFAWYSNKELTFYESDWTHAQNTWTGKIVGIANYEDVATDQHVLLKIHTVDGNENSSSLNINFNRKTGINSGTRLGGNKLMVVSTATPTAYNTSLLESQLDVGESKTFENYWMNDSDLIITVNDISTDTNDVLFADIEISVDFNLEDLIFSDGFDQ